MKDYQTKLEAKGLLKNVKRGQFVQHFIDSELYTYKKLSQVTSSTDESFFIGESEIPKSACNLRFEKDDRSSDYIIVTIQFNKAYGI
tara:strand:+ start:186 stop:446 length:261 start_codon:yes stop_codon:yes gene_type:complete